jgi:ribosomal protein S11
MSVVVKKNGNIILQREMLRGDDGGYYTPSVSDEGVLSWTASETGMQAVPEANIKGKDGVDGKDGVNGVDGKDGIDGKDGVDGESAYQIAVDNGFAGTETEWLASLKGADGKDGTNGTDGTDGQSALLCSYTISDSRKSGSYYIAPNWSFNRTPVPKEAFNAIYAEQDATTLKYTYYLAFFTIYTSDTFSNKEVWWLCTRGRSFKLTGEKGDTGATGANGTNGTNGKDGVSPTVEVTAIDNGNTVTITDATGSTSFNVLNGTDGKNGENGATGANGESAYQIAVDNGYPGAEDEWLASLIGESAYQLAVNDGYTGTEDEWLKSLKGADGKDGTNGTNGTDGVSPTVEVSAIDNGNKVTITDATGSKSFDVTNGTNGTNGTDGHTPVKGTDYWTDADKTEIVNSVIAALPVYNGEVV